MRDILEAKMRDGSRVMQAGNYEVMTAGGVSDGVQRASQAVYDPSVDPSRNIQVAAQGNTYRNGTTRPTNVPTVPPEAIATPEPALDATNPLTPTPAAPRGQAVPSPLPAGVAGGSAMDDAVARQQVLIKQISSDPRPQRGERPGDARQRSENGCFHSGRSASKGRGDEYRFGGEGATAPPRRPLLE